MEYQSTFFHGLLCNNLRALYLNGPISRPFVYYLIHKIGKVIFLAKYFGYERFLLIINTLIRVFIKSLLIIHIFARIQGD